MGNKHVVRFEPVGIEIEVDEDQTVLRAAAEQGIQLMHGCKEGQCAACKSFVLEGEDAIELERYSTFALPDYERDEGMTLLCRAHVYDDVVIELLNYDEEILRSGLPVVRGRATVVQSEAVTHDMRHLTLQLLEPDELRFFPGQYLDISPPGTDESRSFSMINTPSSDGLLEFLIKIYPGGMFSGYLATRCQSGDVLAIEGPFGTFTLRESRRSAIVFIAGGAGLAPVLGLLRSMRERGSDREAVLYYGARREHDLCFEKELRALEEELPAFRYIPALSEEPSSAWEGETGLVTDVVRRLERDLSGRDAYLCGPPVMVDAAIELLTELGVGRGDIFYDKFTTTG